MVKLNKTTCEEIIKNTRVKIIYKYKPCATFIQEKKNVFYHIKNTSLGLFYFL